MPYDQPCTSRPGHNGRVKVDRYLRVLDHPQIYVADDLASCAAGLPCAAGLLAVCFLCTREAAEPRCLEKMVDG
jgi:hypothetical protein